MAAKKYYITDTELEKYIFHVMRLSSDEQRRNLSSSELIHFRSEMNMRRFAENESLEKRLVLLTRLGHSFCVVVAPNMKDMRELYAEDVPGQYDSGEKRVAVVKKMIEKKVFVMSSRDMLVMTQIMAQNAHSGIYTLDYSWVKLKEELSKFRIRTFSEELEDAQDATKDLSILVNSILGSEESLTSLTGCTFYGMRILLSMYQYRQTMVSATKIADIIGESKRSRSVSKACAHLMKREYIIRAPIRKQNGRKSADLYTIAEKGISVVMTYLKYVLKHSMK